MDTGVIDVERIERDAYRSSLSTSTQQMAHQVMAAVGQRRAAAALGLKDARPLKAWSNGAAVKEAATRSRLRVLYRVVHEIERAYSADTAAMFLESTSPYLNERSPLAVLATTSPDEAEKSVISAARALLEG